MGRHNLVHNIEPHPAPARLCRIQGLENPGALRGGDASPGILDVQFLQTRQLRLEFRQCVGHLRGAVRRRLLCLGRLRGFERSHAVAQEQHFLLQRAFE
jgi:hypothetical protein